MFFLHRINMTIRRLCLMGYYKLVFGNKISFGKGFRSRGNFSLFVTEGAHIIFKKNVFINTSFSISANNLVEIGNNCIIGENVKIYDQNHRFISKDKPISQQGFKIGEVKIGNNCWIGSNVTILKDVVIGDNVVIGANCLIYKDIPANSVVTLNERLTIVKRG